jgi:nucleotide-binding universal stress UspA family protein
MPELPRRILVPFDFSALSTEAVDYAALLAARLGASIRLLHVYDPPDSMAAIVPGTSVVEEERSARGVAVGELERLEQAVVAAGAVRADVVVAAGSPVEEILRQAEGFDLIVMGTHGRTGLQRLLLGSVTEEVMRRAHIPVLVVHLPIGH